MAERSWWSAARGALFGAVGIGLGVGIVVGVILAIIFSAGCEPEEDCLATVGGISYGLLTATVTSVIAVIALSIRWRVTVFGVGAAIAMLLFTGPGVLLNPDNPGVYMLLSAVLLVGSAILSRAVRNR